MYTRNFRRFFSARDAHDITNQDHRIHGGQRDVQVLVPVGPCRRTDPEEDVRGEQRAEEHHFRRQEEPDPELRVVDAGVRPRFDGIRYLHR
jgi:hypothetical protein